MTTPLTQLAKTAGCAAKIAQVDLHAALAHLPRVADPRVLIGLDTSDDAAVIRLSDELALVETVDIFTPIVDDPWDYGRIAAANALSDVYAMGARPLSALSFVAWPVSTLGTEPLGRVLAGAAAVCSEAGIAVAGGHSIVDEEPKFGLFVDRARPSARVVSNAGARPGDRLVLTKRLGTGVLTTAVKRGHLTAAELQPAIDSMTTLNRAAAEASGGGRARRHRRDRLRAAGPPRQPLSRLVDGGAAAGARLKLAALPWFERVVELAERDVCPGGPNATWRMPRPTPASPLRFRPICSSCAPTRRPPAACSSPSLRSGWTRSFNRSSGTAWRCARWWASWSPPARPATSTSTRKTGPASARRDRAEQRRDRPADRPPRRRQTQVGGAVATQIARPCRPAG